MSAIHEALKRAREARQTKNPGIPPKDTPSLIVRTGRPVSAWLLWSMLALVLAEGAFFVREGALRRKAEYKMKLAYLELNKARGDSIDVRTKKVEIELQIEGLRNQLKKAVTNKADMSSAKRLVELENLEKEKKISELTKKMHEVEMDKFQLKEEIQSLKRELSMQSSSAERPPKRS
jgi:ribosomal protein S13